MHDDALEKLIARVASTSSGHLLPTHLPGEPFTLLKEWFDDETKAQRTPNPTAMSIALPMPSAEGEGITSRIVLCRGLDARAGVLTFFTNYQGRKGRGVLDAIARRGCCAGAACLHWDATDRQARVEGWVVPASAQESDAYFASRRWENRISAWVSNQSEPVPGREQLLARIPATLARLGLSAQELLDRGESVQIPRPPHWGGFRMYARRVELWLGGPGRLHDRAIWERPLAGAGTREALDAGILGLAWQSTRLQP